MRRVLAKYCLATKGISRRGGDGRRWEGEVGRGGGGSQKGQKSSAESLNVTTYYYHFFSDGFWGSELRAVHPPKQISILLQEKKKKLIKSAGTFIAEILKKYKVHFCQRVWCMC